MPVFSLAPSLRGLDAKQTGGVSYITKDTPSVTAFAVPPPSEREAGDVPIRWEIATGASFPRNDRLFCRGDQKVNCPKGQEKPPWGAGRPFLPRMYSHIAGGS